MSDGPNPKAYQVHLEAWRTHRGLTQEEAAEKLGVVHTTVGRWERGTMAITSASLVDLCRLYEVTPQQLLAPPASASTINRAEQIQRLVDGMDDEGFEHLLFIAKRINPAA